MPTQTCAKCGASLQLVANDTMRKCIRCGAMYFANTALSDIQQSYLQSELTTGDSFLLAKRWDDAISCFANLTKSYPLEIDAWMGVARALTREQTFFALSGEDYKLLCRCLSKVQALQGALVDDSWSVYKTQYERYRDTQRMEIQEQCEKLAYWVDHKQDGDSKMAVRLVLMSAAFLLFVFGCVLCVIDSRLWMLIPITGGVAAVMCWLVKRMGAKADISAEEKRQVRLRCAELEKQAKYWNVQIFFRQDIRNILSSQK